MRRKMASWIFRLEQDAKKRYDASAAILKLGIAERTFGGKKIGEIFIRGDSEKTRGGPGT